MVTAVSIVASGSYDALKEFISQIRESVQLLEITSISFTSPGAEDQEKIVQEAFEFRIDLQTYSN